MQAPQLSESVTKRRIVFLFIPANSQKQLAATARLLADAEEAGLGVGQRMGHRNVNSLEFSTIGGERLPIGFDQ